MNQVSAIKLVEKPNFKYLNKSIIDVNNIVSSSLKTHYLNSGRNDLTDLRMIFLEKFDYLMEFSTNPEEDYKLYTHIDNFFNFIDKNLAVYSEKDYKKLSFIISLALVGIKDSVLAESFQYLYEAYVCLRNDINRFKLSRKVYKENNF